MTLKGPEEVRRLLQRKYEANHRDWVIGGGEWPISITLGSVSEKEAQANGSTMREWIAAWSSCQLPGSVIWEERSWPRLGAHRLPGRLTIETAAQVAVWAGESARWGRACDRLRRVREMWPDLGSGPAASRDFGVLADYPEIEFGRLVSLLSWLQANPNSNLYPRQLPVEGLHTKWLEDRLTVVADWYRAVSGVAACEGDLFDLAGLRRQPYRVRFRILCPKLRAVTGGVCDNEAPLTEVAAMTLQAKKVLIVENRETGLALPEMPDTVAFMRLGNAVSVLATIPWLVGVRCFYWGDIDTHGFAILSSARSHLGHVRSVLMDKATLETHRSLWSHEAKPYAAERLDHLTEAEQEVYQGLKGGAWEQGTRLEQERIPWATVIRALKAEMSTAS